MFARVSTFLGVPGQSEKALETVPPEVKALPGFKGAYALVNRGTGKVMLLTLWESEKAMHEGTDVANRVRSRTAKEAGAIMPAQVEVYEVVAQPEGMEDRSAQRNKTGQFAI